MKAKTTISSDLTHTTKFIDPRSGKVLREGTTPTQTVGEFKANPQQPEEDRIDKLEKDVQQTKDGINEIKNLLKNK